MDYCHSHALIQSAFHNDCARSHALIEKHITLDVAEYCISETSDLDTRAPSVTVVPPVKIYMNDVECRQIDWPILTNSCSRLGDPQAYKP